MASTSSASRDDADAHGARSAQVASPASTARAEDFDPRQLETSTRGARFVAWLLGHHRWVFGFFRWIAPVIQIRGYAFVLRYDEVRETLGHDRDFPVPWGKRMVTVTGGAGKGGENFVLGMPRDEEYEDRYRELARAFPLEEIWATVAKPSQDRTRKIIEDAISDGKQHIFDAIENLIAAVPTRLCHEYYGLSIFKDTDNEKERVEKETDFARRTLAVSSYLFGPPYEKPGVEPSPDENVRAAAAGLRKIIRESIENTRQGNGHGVVLPRLLKFQKDEKAQAGNNGKIHLTDDVIHVHLFGMVMGFIPTNVLAGGNILETLLRRPEMLERARAAALTDDDELLWRCLRETLRFRHINPGPLRICPDGYVFRPVGRREVLIRPGATVLASTQSAMFDRRRIERPGEFAPYRRDEDYMVFGVGQHWCLGAYIAIAQLTHTFKPLLRLHTLAPAGGDKPKMKRYNIFPLHLPIRFEP